MMMTIEQLEEMVHALSHAVDHPELYINEDLPSVVAFLDGLKFACRILGIPEMYDRAFVDSETEHGWNSLSTHVVHQMIARGMSPSEIKKETLSIERDAWKKIASQTNSANKQELFHIE